MIKINETNKESKLTFDDLSVGDWFVYKNTEAENSSIYYIKLDDNRILYYFKVSGFIHTSAVMSLDSNQLDREVIKLDVEINLSRQHNAKA